MEKEIYGATDVGCVRELNEDSFCIYGFDKDASVSFCILSDGMGGHNAGEVASQETVEHIAEKLKNELNSDNFEAPKILTDAIVEANEKVYQMSVKNQEQTGMGATVVASIIADNVAYIANVGDSRAYAWRKNELMQITKDHSMVEEMVTLGTLTRSEARVHPQRNVITRAVGTDSDIRVDIFEYDYIAGDKLLVCSDGLSAMVDDDEINEVLSSNISTKETVDCLIDKAKKNGGSDNITVICMEFIQEG